MRIWTGAQASVFQNHIIIVLLQFKLNLSADIICNHALRNATLRLLNIFKVR